MSSPQFDSIAVCLAAKKGNFKGVVIKESDLKAGTGNSGDWTRKVFTIQDSTGEIKITAWNDEIKLLKVGSFVEITNPWYKEHEGKLVPSLGKYAKVRTLEEATTNTQEAVRTSEEIEPEPKGPGSVNGEELPKLNTETALWVNEEAVEILQIRQEVLQTIGIYYPRLDNGGLVGLITKEIYRQRKIKEGDGEV